MKIIRTKKFYLSLKIVSGFSVAFLMWMLLLGKKLAASHFDNVTASVFAVLAIAAVCFLAFSFLPYFKGDKRWFSIPAILTGVFFVSLVIIWNAPMPMAVI
ncbi:MAG: hypothetical protein IJF33_06995 [Clostridia bacterium]|nr:hypothetical protein [Clostridia bacterium]